MSGEKTGGYIETPCTRVCAVHPVDGLCRGCARTLEEIGGWTRMTPDERREVMAELPARMLKWRAA